MFSEQHWQPVWCYSCSEGADSDSLACNSRMRTTKNQSCDKYAKDLCCTMNDWYIPQNCVLFYEINYFFLPAKTEESIASRNGLISQSSYRLTEQELSLTPDICYNPYLSLSVPDLPSREKKSQLLKSQESISFSLCMSKLISPVLLYPSMINIPVCLQTKL